jgi:hypothetical protein
LLLFSSDVGKFKIRPVPQLRGHHPDPEMVHPLLMPWFVLAAGSAPYSRA